tara:strand:+ start:1444 stop:1548 length:105 start_codon:yes stop_codon:yes gene_type:complete
MMDEVGADEPGASGDYDFSVAQRTFSCGILDEYE